MQSGEVLECSPYFLLPCYFTSAKYYGEFFRDNEQTTNYNYPLNNNYFEELNSYNNSLVHNNFADHNNRFY